ncbi:MULTISPECIES: TetR/AcrR family transcriptional regulator [unclassified Pseudoalteromonas]|uniref:TetR/AcrR family transcriptional regulator n=1 Tax=unclassified Pseudoalteromonas TaxID=194690 RepID=UPI002574809F|nr:TetR/AcrR family transcriptional regulator [Pseudoalteromonas sp. MM1]BED89566.1 TetR family transcriptional regulator [Pseudoalteromonas sp. MM1]
MSKREKIINTALTLFYNKGIHAVGINEILTVSGIAKKTLYNHFESKDELIVACLKQRDATFNQWLEQICDKPNAIGVASALFDGLNQWFNNEVSELGNFNGCFFINAAAEYPNDSHPIAIQCKTHKQEALNIVFNALLTTEELKNDKNKALYIAHLLFTIKEGLICQARVMHTTTLKMPSSSLIQHLLQN